ncbi:TIGR03619 family F420-dependent LLM class oxidoreductase [Rhodococcus gordoniae]|uniref:TIGR03619 family F420-dependent LLM class oxidoreductase n=1 Tax=Rhodococcus gordoniae TaxID=223392 RepID=UPI0020CF444B|nr:TIGR03619 family F420-dependent LLM class oxidoreductase [Rhodococcus gordoniae]UTT51012.1 TIGR03619 family F420-dependent LLM class oxidoreductase [Rhodococcus gordoniae]
MTSTETVPGIGIEQITVNLTGVRAEWLVPLAQAADRLGFGALSVGDSIFYPQESDSRYPYNSTGDRTFLETIAMLDPFVLLGHLAAVTERIRLQTSVTKVTVRHPVLVAKQVSSLAVLAEGRIRLGVGMSPWPEDYSVLGIAEQGRGARFEEALSILRSLVTEGYHEHHGRHYDFDPIKLNPVPVQPIALLVGGHGTANLRRAATLGDGWIAAATDHPTLAGLIETVRSARAEANLDWQGYEVHASGQADRSAAGLRQLADLGVTNVAIRPTPDGMRIDKVAHVIEHMEWLATELDAASCKN